MDGNTALRLADAARPFAEFRTPSKRGSYSDKIEDHFGPDQFTALREAIHALEGGPAAEARPGSPSTGAHTIDRFDPNHAARTMQSAPGGEYVTYEDHLECVRQASAVMGPVAVKRLLWESVPQRSGDYAYKAATPFGDYVIAADCLAKRSYTLKTPFACEKEYPSFDAAQQSAQADFEQRVRDALADGDTSRAERERAETSMRAAQASMRDEIDMVRSEIRCGIRGGIAGIDVGPNGRDIVELDWVKVAKLAGEHGIRYRTNRGLKAFLVGIFEKIDRVLP